MNCHSLTEKAFKLLISLKHIKSNIWDRGNGLFWNVSMKTFWTLQRPSCSLESLRRSLIYSGSICLNHTTCCTNQLQAKIFTENLSRLCSDTSRCKAFQGRIMGGCSTGAVNAWQSALGVIACLSVALSAAAVTDSRIPESEHVSFAASLQKEESQRSGLKRRGRRGPLSEMPCWWLETMSRHKWCFQ